MTPEIFLEVSGAGNEQNSKENSGFRCGERDLFLCPRKSPVRGGTGLTHLPSPVPDTRIVLQETSVFNVVNVSEGGNPFGQSKASLSKAV